MPKRTSTENPPASPDKPCDLALFGIPISNTGKEAMTAACIQEIAYPSMESEFLHISAIRTTSIAKCYGFKTSYIKQPELLHVLRNSAIAVASSTLLRCIARCLGTPLAHTSTPSEFLANLCRALNAREKSLFILGGVEKKTKKAAINLHDQFHGLKLVGIATPPIFTQGENLIHSRERDALLAEQINASHADLLLVNLGSPKQEIWLERMRFLLRVPLIFTASNTLEELYESQERKTNGYHFFDQIKKIGTWAAGNAKIIGMSLPLIAFHTINRSVFQWFYENDNSTKIPSNTQLFLSTSRSIAVITLPALMDSTNIDTLQRLYDDAASHEVLVFNFEHVRHIQPEGFCFLIRAWLKRRRHSFETYAFAPTSDIRTLMKIHRIWDLLKDSICDSPEMLMGRLSGIGENAAFYDTFSQEQDNVVVSILGALDNRIDFDAYIQKLTPIIGQKNCTFDLSLCTLIDNSGFTFLLTLAKKLQQRNCKLKFNALSHSLRRLFRLAGVEKILLNKKSNP